MICTYCASLVPADARVCQQCGAPQPFTPTGHWRRATVTIERDVHAFSSEPPVWADAPHARRSSQLARLLDPARQHPAAHAGPHGWHTLPVRSFRRHALIAFVLYFPFFLPGFIASAVWWREATSIEQRP